MSMPAESTESSESTESTRQFPPCGNCGVQLQGDFCHRCGQPVRGLVRHFSSFFGDFVDTVFDLDSRTLRTLFPLLFRPGWLTLRYFEGQRVRYVSPVRLFFFCCVLAFLALRFSVDVDNVFAVGPDSRSQLEKMETPEEVEQWRDAEVTKLQRLLTEIPEPGRVGVETSIEAVEEAARERLEWLAERDGAVAEGRPPPPSSGGEFRFRFGSEAWDAETNPVTVDWLPKAANTALNRMIGRAQRNIEQARNEPGHLIEALLQNLPQALFLLLPVFALLLKVFYLFARRLYMEHLIVALHSHAFLCASLLVIVGLNLLDNVAGAWLGGAIGVGLSWLQKALLIWMPLYLLLMQKRVYGQGWILTLGKYFVLGNIYCVLIGFVIVGALALSLVSS